MFGGSFDWAILSSPLALQRVKRFGWSGYAVSGVCRLRGGTTQVLPDYHRHQLGVLFWPARTIGRGAGQSIAQSLKRPVGDQHAPACSPGTQGSMTGGPFA
ncbi:MAG: hypothetical protein GDA36_13035 [Rhodobacteraceae bacterium]|nr:hypothetical protein [Paracoccaceae bacterium]